MKQVGVYDAKSHLSELIEEVERGETITITRHGKPVAKLVPVGVPKRDVHDVIEEILEARKGRSLGPGVTIKQLIEEGRR